MEYNVEEISPVERKVTVTVPSQEVDAAILATTALYRKDADFNGFRKGKVPSGMVEAKFKKQIYNEATTDLINVHVSEVLGELKLAPLSGLNMDLEGRELEREKDFTYSFTFEVAPKLELPEYKNLKVQEEKVEVNEDEVDAVVDRIRGNMAETVEVEGDRTPVDGEIAVVSFAALGDQAFEGLKADNFELELGAGQALEEFEELVKTLKPGEQGQKAIQFPEDFINEDLAGKTADMRVQLKVIKEKRLPELNDDLAKSAGGFPSVEAMRKAIEDSYVQSRTQLAKSAAQKEMLDGLVKDMAVDLPPSLVEKHTKFLVQRHVDNLERNGKSLTSTGKTEEQLAEEFKPQAEALTKDQVVLLAIAEAEEITVQPHEVEAVVRQAAQQSGQDFQELMAYHEQTGLIWDVKDRIVADKAMEFLYGEADVEMVEPACETKDEGEA